MAESFKDREIFDRSILRRKYNADDYNMRKHEI